MQKRRTVAILGQSLLMAGLGASMRGQEALQVLRVEDGWQDLPARLAALHPDAVIFDLDTVEAGLLLKLLTQCCGLLFVGLGIAGNRAVAFSSYAHTALSAGDLIGLIEREVGRLESRSAGAEGTRGN